MNDLAIDTAAGPLRMRHYRADAGGRPAACMVYFHGGGFVQGDLETHDVFCRQLCLTSGISVVAVDYRLAPEHPFPAAVSDAMDATRWILDNGRSLGIDPRRVALGGDSAGGNLATVAALGLKAYPASHPLKAQILLYPVADQHGEHPSKSAFASGYLLTRRAIEYYATLYFIRDEQRKDWRASPLLHPDLSGLPPALVITAGFDPLRDEGQAYAARLARAGVEVESRCYDGQVHGFATRSKSVPEALDALALCARFLRVRL